MLRKMLRRRAWPQTCCVPQSFVPSVACNVERGVAAFPSLAFLTAGSPCRCAQSRARGSLAPDRSHTVLDAVNVSRKQTTANGVSSEHGRHKDFGRDDRHSERRGTWEGVLLRSTIQSSSYGSGKKGALSRSPMLSLGRSGSGPDEDANPLLSGADVAEDECETPRSKTDASEPSLNPVVLSSCPKPLRTLVPNLQEHQDTDVDDVETSAISPTNVRMSPDGHGSSQGAVNLRFNLDRHMEAGKMVAERACAAASAGRSFRSDPADEEFRFSILEPAPVRSLHDIGRSIVEEVRASYGRKNFMEHVSPSAAPADGAAPSTEVDVPKMSILSPETFSTSVRDSRTNAPNMRGSSSSMVDAALLRELDAGARCTSGHPWHIPNYGSVMFNLASDDCAMFHCVPACLHVHASLELELRK
jgi:hypothetical protein